MMGAVTTMNPKETKNRLEERPVSDEHPQKRSYLFLKEEIALIEKIRVRYSLINLNQTEIVRAAIRALAKADKELGMAVILKLPKVRHGRKPDDGTSL
jgi:hypothetical protein